MIYVLLVSYGSYEDETSVVKLVGTDLEDGKATCKAQYGTTLIDGNHDLEFNWAELQGWVNGMKMASIGINWDGTEMVEGTEQEWRQ